MTSGTGVKAPSRFAFDVSIDWGKLGIDLGNRVSTLIDSALQAANEGKHWRGHIGGGRETIYFYLRYNGDDVPECLAVGKYVFPTDAEVQLREAFGDWCESAHRPFIIIAKLSLVPVPA